MIVKSRFDLYQFLGESRDFGNCFAHDEESLLTFIKKYDLESAGQTLFVFLSSDSILLECYELEARQYMELLK